MRDKMQAVDGHVHYYRFYGIEFGTLLRGTMHTSFNPEFN